jgi:hypothetical protein
MVNQYTSATEKEEFSPSSEISDTTCSSYQIESENFNNYDLCDINNNFNNYLTENESVVPFISTSDINGDAGDLFIFAEQTLDYIDDFEIQNWIIHSSNPSLKVKRSHIEVVRSNVLEAAEIAGLSLCSNDVSILEVIPKGVKEYLDNHEEIRKMRSAYCDRFRRLFTSMLKNYDLCGLYEACREEVSLEFDSFSSESGKCREYRQSIQFEDFGFDVSRSLRNGAWGDCECKEIVLELKCLHRFLGKLDGVDLARISGLLYVLSSVGSLDPYCNKIA